MMLCCVLYVCVIYVVLCCYACIEVVRRGRRKRDRGRGGREAAAMGRELSLRPGCCFDAFVSLPYTTRSRCYCYCCCRCRRQSDESETRPEQRSTRGLLGPFWNSASAFASSNWIYVGLCFSRCARVSRKIRDGIYGYRSDFNQPVVCKKNRPVFST